MTHSENKLGVAILGLGNYSTYQIVPALLSYCEKCQLTGIVSGTPMKTSMWRRKYNLHSENVYSYENFDAIADNERIDIIYVTVPNALHLDFVLRAARAGKHVICEKPLGLSEAECQEMIQTCIEHRVKLSVGYRLLYDPYFNHLRSLINQDGDPVSRFHGRLGFSLDNHPGWRFNSAMAGGGSLMDVGIYGIYVSCFLLNQRPGQVKVNEYTLKDSSDGLETSISFTMFFEGFEVLFEAGYDRLVNELHIESSSKQIFLLNAFSPSGQVLTVNGEQKKFEQVNQLALHLDDFSESIRTGKTAKVTSDIGLRDVQIISALYRSMKSGKVESVIYS